MDELTIAHNDLYNAIRLELDNEIIEAMAKRYVDLLKENASKERK
jgi:hypothetical protein